MNLKIGPIPASRVTPNRHPAGLVLHPPTHSLPLTPLCPIQTSCHAFSSNTPASAATWSTWTPVGAPCWTPTPIREAVRAHLGQALAAVALLSATVKFDGSLILQVQGAGPLRTLVAQATSARTLRGVARWEGEVPASGDLATAAAPGAWC